MADNTNNTTEPETSTPSTVNKAAEFVSEKSAAAAHGVDEAFKYVSEKGADVSADASQTVDKASEYVKEKSASASENLDKASEYVKEKSVAASQTAEKASEYVAEKSVDASHNAFSALKQVDRLILRLNKLLSTPGGLSASLSTLNYVLYILTYLQPKLPSPAHLASKLLSTSPKPLIKTLVNDPASIPSVAALAGLLAKCRTTLRLFGTFPLYAWLRSLLGEGPKAGSDIVLHRIATLQASSYLIYQTLENVCLLADCGAVPSSFIARINRGDSTTARVYLYAYRAWLGGISCDFLRLAREAQLENQRRETRKKLTEDGHETAYYQEEEDAKVDKKWWNDLMIASAWLPMALHYSSTSGGIPGWNLGWMGVCGLVAGGQRFQGMWQATA